MQRSRLPRWLDDDMFDLMFRGQGPESYADEDSCDFPDALTACTRLRRLSLNFTGSHMWIGELPEAICALQNLQSLRLVRCGVRCLPRSFSQLSALSQLMLLNGSGDGSWEPYMDMEYAPCTYAGDVAMPLSRLNALPALKDVQVD